MQLVRRAAKPCPVHFTPPPKHPYTSTFPSSRHVYTQYRNRIYAAVIWMRSQTLICRLGTVVLRGARGLHGVLHRCGICLSAKTGIPAFYRMRSECRTNSLVLHNAMRRSYGGRTVRLRDLDECGCIQNTAWHRALNAALHLHRLATAAVTSPDPELVQWQFPRAYIRSVIEAFTRSWQRPSDSQREVIPPRHDRHGTNEGEQRPHALIPRPAILRKAMRRPVDTLSPTS